MGRGARRSLDRVGSLVVVLGGHVLLLAGLVSGRSGEQRKITTDLLQPLIWIPVTPDIPPVQPRERTVEATPRPRPQIPRATFPSETRVGAAPALTPAPAALSPSELVAEAPDWSLEAQRVAKSMAPGMISELQRTCAEAERRAEALPEGCKRPSVMKKWEPEPKRAGFIGIFPYVRVGRCIIGLGFWGCAVGTRTPDGSVFEDMRNPDRPHSSVPDSPAPMFPRAPVPQVAKGAPELLQ